MSVSRLSAIGVQVLDAGGTPSARLSAIGVQVLVLDPDYAQQTVDSDLDLQWGIGLQSVYSSPLDLRWEILDFIVSDMNVAWAIGPGSYDESYLTMGVLGATFLENSTPANFKGERQGDLSGTSVDAEGPSAPSAKSALGNVQLTQVTGGLCLHFAGDYYYRIWVIPESMNLQNPQIGVPVPFEVWNAYPWSNQLNTITPTDADGLEIDLSAPSTFREIELRTVNITILPSAPIQIDASYVFDFADGDGAFSFTATIADFVQMVPDVPVLEYWDWLTDIITSHDSSEQRIALRATPRRSSNYKFLLESDTERRKQFNRWYKSLATRLVLPYYQYATNISQRSVTGATRLYFEPGRTDVRDGEFVIVLDVINEQGYLVKLGTVDANGATLSDPLTFDVEENWVISPAFTSRIADNTGPTMYAVHGEITVNSQALDVREQFTRPGSSAVINSFDGHNVLDRRPLANDAVPDNLKVNYEVIDSETGLLDIKTSWPHPFLNGPRKFLIQRLYDPNEMDWWRDFLDAARGRQNPFLLPTWRADLVAASAPSPGTPQLIIDSKEYASLYFPYESYKRLQIETEGGIIWRKVLQVTDNGDGTQTLELSASFGLQPEDVQINRVSFLNLARLGSDRVTLSHGHHDTTIQIDIRTVDA